MSHIYRNLAIVIAVLILAVYAIYPPEKSLRLGKDLSGGVSLVYSITVSDSENADEVINRTIDTLKRRVDPDGLMEISMVKAGEDRIEITMPLPSDKVKALKKVFDDQLASLRQKRLTEARVEQVLRMPAEQRTAEIARLGQGNPKRAELLNQAAAAFDEAAAKSAELRTLTDPAARAALVSEIASAELRSDAARAAALATSLSPDDIRRVVDSSTRRRRIMDNGVSISLDSPQEVARQQLYLAHPESKEEIDQILAAYDAYVSQRTTLDDPGDLVRMLKGAGVLSFRITVDPGKHPDEARLRREFQELGPRNVKSTDTRWLKINQIDGWVQSKSDIDFLTADPRQNTPAFFRARGYVAEFRAGEYYMLCYNTSSTVMVPGTDEGVAQAGTTKDRLGRDAISFEMKPAGGVKLGQLTGQHVGEKMAVVLDDEVYTAPNLRSEIGSNGVIEGDFSREEIDYIQRVLAGGSLTAKLSTEPISIESVGPELGTDNLRKGLHSGLVAFVAVSIFMVVYYFASGLIAVLALAIAGVLMVALMAIQHTAFTLPAIAGIVLSFGQAVDANVLVYERMREELKAGHDMRTATRIGFHKATPAIVDANISHLIICFVLYQLGTQEIRGFAIALAVGVLATLFACLVFSRLIFSLLVDTGVWRKASMLPIALPPLQRALEPHINWLKLRPVFLTLSILYMVVCIAVVRNAGENLLDTEFRGGTQVTLQLGLDDQGKQIYMTREQAHQRIEQLATAGKDDQLDKLAAAEVVPVNPQSDGVTSDKFRVRSLADQSQVVLSSLQRVFDDVLASEPELVFTNSAMNDAPPTAYPLLRATATESINRQVPGESESFRGGVAIVLENIDPSIPLDTLVERLDRRRLAEYSDTLERRRDVRILQGTEDAVQTAVLLISDPDISAFDSEDLFNREVVGREWQLVRAALTQSGQIADVETFSPAVAESFKVKALLSVIVSIAMLIIYIWIRYGTPRWALAATLPILHDVIGMVGAVALARLLHDHPSTNAFARQILILPFGIDINMVAAILTMAGFSLNDKVIILDRIRENKGKLAYATGPMINQSINQTLSRTMITTGLILMTTLVLYFFGGEAIRGFAFVFTIGAILGTYSSIAIAAPLVWSRKTDKLPPASAIPSSGPARLQPARA